MQAVPVPEPEPGRGEPYICQAPRQTLSIQVRRVNNMELAFLLQLRKLLVLLFAPQYIFHLSQRFNLFFSLPHMLTERGALS